MLQKRENQDWEAEITVLIFRAFSKIVLSLGLLTVEILCDFPTFWIHNCKHVSPKSFVQYKTKKGEKKNFCWVKLYHKIKNIVAES